MTTTKLAINSQEVANILKAGSWDYEYCSQRISESMMNELVADLENADYTEQEVNTAIGNEADDIADAFDGIGNYNEFVAVYIADRIAQAKVDCPNETVTFKFNC